MIDAGRLPARVAPDQTLHLGAEPTITERRREMRMRRVKAEVSIGLR